MCINLNMFDYICSVETALVNLQAQYRIFKPFWGVLAVDDPKGFFFFTRFNTAKGPGGGQTWNTHSLDQVNGVLDSRKPHRQICFSRGSFSFFSFKLLRGLVAFPFLSFGITLFVI